MAVRLVVTITAAPGKGSELAQMYKARCEECMKEPGCEQFEGLSKCAQSGQAGFAGALGRPSSSRRSCQIERHSTGLAAGAARRRW